MSEVKDNNDAQILEEPANKQVAQEPVIDNNDAQVAEVIKQPKIKKTFKDYYNNNPAFKAKHIKYICEKIECDCGSILARGNMYNHKKTKKHNQIMDKLAKNNK